MMLTIEQALAHALEHAKCGAPPKLAQALSHAVFPGGARVRPRLCVAVAEAHGANHLDVAVASAAALELVHCASLVHDDLPCFDDADLRRGKPSVHRAFGEATAVLTGDALIALAFETLGRAGGRATGALVVELAAAMGAPRGLCAGQGWEQEQSIDRVLYHRAKTSSLFVAAVACGAIAAGRDPEPWRVVGERLGDAYQVADDLLDAHARASEAGKPTRRDVALARPSAVRELGTKGAVARLRSLVEEAVAAVPECEGAAALRSLVVVLAERLVPSRLRQSAA